MLRRHPDVCLAQPKELNFFNDNLGRGLAWYAEHFAQAGRPVQGEISPLYMDHPDVAGRIAETFPDVQILVVLRNPYERAISNLLHDVRGTHGQVASASLELGRHFAQQSDEFIRRSCYAAALGPYYRHFSRAQVSVLFYEDLTASASNFLRTLYSSVGARPDFVSPDFERYFNQTKDFVSPTLFKVLSRISRAAKSFAPGRKGMEWLYRHTRLREWVLDRFAVNRGRPQLSFRDVFGDEAVERIARDIERLRCEMRIDVPDQWLTNQAADVHFREAA
jgi:hypothetical protein